MTRYNVSGTEGEYEPGSDNRVLRNLAGITDPADMNIAETELLGDLYIQVFDHFPEGLEFQTLCNWHRAWLGQEAKVNLVKRRVPDLRRFSITSVRSPVSIALELATARRMRLCETVTLTEDFLRTMAMLLKQYIKTIIALAISKFSNK